MTLTEIISRFDAHKNGNGWMAKCPIHADSTASLSISEGKDGRILLNCFAKCETKNIGLKIVPDLYEILSGQARTSQIYGIPLIDIMPRYECWTKRPLPTPN